jgi:hypothetical protein
MAAASPVLQNLCAPCVRGLTSSSGYVRSAPFSHTVSHCAAPIPDSKRVRRHLKSAFRGVSLICIHVTTCETRDACVLDM